MSRASALARRLPQHAGHNRTQKDEIDDLSARVRFFLGSDDEEGFWAIPGCEKLQCLCCAQGNDVVGGNALTAVIACSPLRQLASLCILLTASIDGAGRGPSVSKCGFIAA